MCDLCDEYEISGFHVCILCFSDGEIVVEAGWAAAVEIDIHIAGVNSSSMLMGLHSAMMCKTNIFLIYTG